MPARVTSSLRDGEQLRGHVAPLADRCCFCEQLWFLVSWCFLCLFWNILCFCIKIAASRACSKPLGDTQHVTLRTPPRFLVLYICLFHLEDFEVWGILF